LPLTYCRNCGAKLNDDVRFCPVCGTPVSPVATPQQGVATPEPTRRSPVRRAGFPIVAIAMVIIVLLVAAAFIVTLFPFQQVTFSQSNETSAHNVNTLQLVLNADVADVNVILMDLPGNQLAATNVSATGWRGIFGTDQPLALSFNEDTNNSTLTWFVNVSRAGNWPIVNMLNVQCDVYADPSVNLAIMVRTGTGTITMDADQQATFTDLVLQTTTGSVTATMRGVATIDNRIVVETTTGSVQFVWDNPEVTTNVPVSLRATTGTVDVNVTQARQLQGNVTLDAETVTGSVSLNMGLQNGVGARIAASTTLGGVNVQQQGFSGNQVPLQSSNYPAGSNFDLTLRATTGGVNINAAYQIVGSRS
jgi:hypothetical protein